MKTPAFLPFFRAKTRTLATTAIGLCSAFLPGFSSAQNPATGAPAEQREGCVWQISDGDNTVYLAGSVHLLREKDYPVSAVYDQAYANSAELVMEIDMAEMTNPAGMLKMQQLGMYSGGDTLDQHLSAETIGRLRTYLNTHEMGKMMAMALPQLKPGMILLSISSLEAMRMNARPELGLEMTYFQKSLKDEKPLSGLETMEFQMKLFDDFTDAEIEELLSKTLDEIEEMPKMIDDLIQAWHVGDAEKLDKILNEQMEDESKIREMLLTGRNANWIPEIEKAIKGSTNVMFIVGAAHLIGKDSVLDLLKKKGYQIKKLTPKAALKKAA